MTARPPCRHHAPPQSAGRRPAPPPPRPPRTRPRFSSRYRELSAPDEVASYADRPAHGACRRGCCDRGGVTVPTATVRWSHGQAAHPVGDADLRPGDGPGEPLRRRGRARRPLPPAAAAAPPTAFGSAGSTSAPAGKWLRKRLDVFECDEHPFTGGRPRERGIHWVRPELVAEIGFTEWTGDGELRHPRQLGLRTDKPATEIVRERPDEVRR
ncbi:hypothetical protein [Streptomyces sp. NPDC053048]|uniref:ATP dependent DNA ligase n=1 Tax=Streptomyces sp. NPDC053048 TaxID=3365694 RepID=UPI0037CD1733